MRLRNSVLALAIAASSCAANPPPNLYTTQQTRIYQTENAEQAVIALSQMAVSLNASTGPTHLSDANTRLVRDFALAFDAWRTGYSNGTATVQQILATYTQLNTALQTDASSAGLKAILATVQVALNAIPQ